MMQDYILISRYDFDYDGFIREVKDFMKKGWAPQGGVHLSERESGTYYTQAMILKSPDAPQQTKKD